MHFLLETYADIHVSFMVVLRIEPRALMCSGSAFLLSSIIVFCLLFFFWKQGLIKLSWLALTSVCSSDWCRLCSSSTSAPKYLELRPGPSVPLWAIFLKEQVLIWQETVKRPSRPYEIQGTFPWGRTGGSSHSRSRAENKATMKAG